MFTFLSKLLSKLAHLLGGVVVLFLFLIGVLIFIPIYIYRYLICKLGKYLNPSLGEMLPAVGHLMGGTEIFGETSRCAIVIAAVVDTSKTIEEMKSISIEKLLYAKVSSHSEELKYPEMQQYLTSWMGFIFWKPEPNFNFDDHINIIQSKSQGREFSSKNETQNLIEQFVNEPFPVGKSPWSITIIENGEESHENCEKPSEKLFIIKIHHCASDAYGILFTILDNLSNEPLNLPVPNYVGDSRGFLATFGFLVAFPFRAFLELLEIAGMAFKSHPWKIEDCKKSWKQVYMQSEIIPVKKIKEIKSTLGVSFTSVVHSAYASATRQSLLRKYGGQADFEYTPCGFILPLPNHPKKLRNHNTAAHLRLPTTGCDPIQRLRLCEEDIQSAKKSTIPYLMNFIALVVGSLPSCFVSLLGKNKMLPLFMSNFPAGAISHLDIVGGKLVRLAAGAGAGPGATGVVYIVYSCGDGIQFTATAESALMTHQDLRHLLDCVEKEIDVLYQLATNIINC